MMCKIWKKPDISPNYNHYSKGIDIKFTHNFKLLNIRFYQVSLQLRCCPSILKKNITSRMIEQMSLLDAISKCFSESYDEARRKFLDADEGLRLTSKFGLLKFD